MKIGDFARKYNISIDTVRHYLNLQLLLTEKKGSQYKFTEEDSKDLEEIIELKNLKFSLIEIQNILTYKRLASDKANDFREHFKSFLEEKKQELERSKKELNQALDYINGKIHEVECGVESFYILGLPIKALDKLKCLNCNSGLNISEGHIEKNMIISGKFTCNCNENLFLEDGIIIDRNEIREKSMPSKQEYYKKTSPRFINFVFKSMASLINTINDEKVDKEYILEIGSCCGFFLMNYLPYLKQDSTYIVVDYDLNRLKKLKCDLEANHRHSNFIFICSNYGKLPIMDNSLDLILDCFSTAVHAENNGEILSKSYFPLLKEEGKYGGIYAYFDTDNKHIKGILENIRDYFNKRYILDMLNRSKLKRLDIKENGPAEEGGEFNEYVEGNNYCHLIYFGKKEAR